MTDEEVIHTLDSIKCHQVSDVQVEALDIAINYVTTIKRIKDTYKQISSFETTDNIKDCRCEDVILGLIATVIK